MKEWQDTSIARDADAQTERARVQALHLGFDALTAREREVLTHVVRGRRNKQIAADLGIHERRVKLHRTALTTKLKVRSAVEPASLVQAAGLLDSDNAHFPIGQ